jgi:outer membrane protein TolC
LPQANLNVGVGGISADGRPGGSNANASLNVAQGSLSLTGTYFPVGESPVGSSLSVSVSLGLPVIAPGNDGRIAAAQAGLEAARFALINSKALADLDIRQKHLALEAARAQVNVSSANTRLLEQRLADTTARLGLGLASAIEVDAADLALRQGMREASSAGLNAVLADLRLEAATGAALITSP